jgi:molecular chaperone DnaJ
MARYYQRLGISPSAAKEQVKAAFRAQARTYHPDLNSAPDAEEKFKEIGEAYEQIKKAQGWN